MNKLLRVSALALGLIVMSASFAAAAGLNLAWTDCFSDGGTSNRTFACAANTGSNALFGSFVPPAGVTAMTGAEVVIDLLTEDPAFSNWWRMFTGYCDYVKGANIAGFKKVADAMLAYGVV